MKYLPHICEIANSVPRKGSPTSYFDGLSAQCCENHIDAMKELENYLSQLDNDAWSVIKPRLAKVAEICDNKRHWQPPFDAITEVKAYTILKELRYTDIRFIPVSDKPGTKTPDLQAIFNEKWILCDAKK